MLRNEKGPRWTTQTPLSLTIKETIPVGTVITDEVNAQDEDGVSVASMVFYARPNPFLLNELIMLREREIEKERDRERE